MFLRMILLIAFCTLVVYGCDRDKLSDEQVVSLQRLQKRCAASNSSLPAFSFVAEALSQNLGSGGDNARLHCVLFSPDSARFGVLASYQTKRGSYAGQLILGYRELPTQDWQVYTSHLVRHYGGLNHKEIRDDMVARMGAGLKDRRSFMVHRDVAGEGGVVYMESNFGSDAFWTDVLWRKDLRIAGAYVFEARRNATNRDPLWIRREPIVTYPADSLHQRLKDTG